MNFLYRIWHLLLNFPEYLPGVASALAVLMLAVPVYFGMWYFLRRRNLPFPPRLHVGTLSSFVLFAGLAFIFASPLSSKVPSIALNAYLFVACSMLAYSVVPLVDVFVIEYYMMTRKGIYISPPLHKVLNTLVFILSFIPIMRYMLRFNPFAMVALPTIVTAGIALALQDSLKAFFAGVGLGQMIRIGDWVSFQKTDGRVVDIQWARTVLRTMHGDLLSVPNTQLLTQPLLNYSARHSHRFTLKVNVAYSAPPERVKQAMLRCTKEFSDIADSPTPSAQVLSMENGFIQYALFYWVDDFGKHFDVQDKLATRVWEAFHQEGFEIPLPFPTYSMDEGFHPVPSVKTPLKN